MELKIEFSPARNWISGLKGIYSIVKNQQTSEKGKKPSTNFEASSSKKTPKKFQERFSRRESCCCDSSKGKTVLCGSEVEELNERLKVLEEETEMLKEAFFWSLEERKFMMNEIFNQFQLLHGGFKPRNMVIEEETSVVNTLEDWRIRNSLPEFLSAYQNPPLITRELRAGTFAFQEPAIFRRNVKFHHD